MCYVREIEKKLGSYKLQVASSHLAAKTSKYGLFGAIFEVWGVILVLEDRRLMSGNSNSKVSMIIFMK